MIDAHQHCWQIGAHQCTWPTPDLSAIYRDFSVSDLQALAEPLGVRGSVLVQSQPSDADTDFLLQCARAHPFVKAVVGWVDLASEEAPARIAYLAQQPKLRGLRPMLQGLDEDDWILRPELAPAIAAMLEHGLSFDALVYPRHLPYLRIFAERYPHLPIVIDHAAKPAIAAHEPPQYRAWCQAMAELAALPQVMCKVSGLVTEAGRHQGAEILTDYLAQLLQLFGPHRLLWGSDWPVVDLAANPSLASYEGWLALSKRFFARQPAVHLNAIFGENARGFYRF